ncbi:MAG: hypothetical protein AAGB05_06785 [Pseudomonadota bacterium]
MTRSRILLGFGFAWLCAMPALAQDQSTDKSDAALALTLDGIAQTEAACRLTFVARNGLAADVASLVVEAVAFSPDGGVERIALFDFSALPVDRLRVRQFDLPGTACAAVGSMLVNGVQRCEGDGLDPDACAAAITVSSRADVELLG